MCGKRTLQPSDEEHYPLDVVDSEEDEESLEEVLDEDLVEGDEALGSGDDLEGVPIEPFSMRTEMDEGYFDKETGAYVWRQKSEDVKDEHDSEEESGDETWLKVSEAEMQSALEAAKKRNQEQTVSSDVDNLEEKAKELISMLEPQETPMEGIARRGVISQSRRRFVKMKPNSTAPVGREDKMRRTEIERITELCATLPIAESDIYGMSREQIMRHFRTHQGL
jgi:hypothetical protein